MALHQFLIFVQIIFAVFNYAVAAAIESENRYNVNLHGWQYAHATFYGDIFGRETMGKYGFVYVTFDELRWYRCV